jgi:hypothetical protein
VTGDLFEDFLGGLIVVPESGRDRVSLKLGYLLLPLGEVKDTSLACRHGF